MRTNRVCYGFLELFVKSVHKAPEELLTVLLIVSSERRIHRLKALHESTRNDEARPETRRFKLLLIIITKRTQKQEWPIGIQKAQNFLTTKLKT